MVGCASCARGKARHIVFEQAHGFVETAYLVGCFSLLADFYLCGCLGGGCDTDGETEYYGEYFFHLLFLEDWNDQCETRSGMFHRVELYAAVVLIDDVAGDRHTESCALSEWLGGKEVLVDFFFHFR